MKNTSFAKMSSSQSLDYKTPKEVFGNFKAVV